MTALRSNLRDLLSSAAIVAGGIGTGLVIAVLYLTAKFLGIAGS